MQNFQDTFETRKRPLTSGFLICMTVPLKIEFPINNTLQLVSRKVLRITGNRISSEKVIVRYKHVSSPKRFKFYVERSCLM